MSNGNRPGIEIIPWAEIASGQLDLFRGHFTASSIRRLRTVRKPRWFVPVLTSPLPRVPTM